MCIRDSNQPISAQLSHAHFHVLFCVLKKLWQQWRKACGEICRSHRMGWLKAKACSKNSSKLKRVDSRVQCIWRLRVMGSYYSSFNQSYHCFIRRRCCRGLRPCLSSLFHDRGRIFQVYPTQDSTTLNGERDTLLLHLPQEMVERYNLNPCLWIMESEWKWNLALLPVTNTILP